MPDDINNPLLSLHRQAEAEFQAYGTVQVVSTFGEPQAEYGAVRKACGLIDLPQRGIIEISGKDRLTFLNNLVTNQTWDKQRKAGLGPGEGVYAYLLHAKNGKVMADLNILELGDGRTLLETDRRLIPSLIETLGKYHFSEQIEIHDRSTSLHQVALHGPGAAAVIEQVLDVPIALLDRPGFSAVGKAIGIDVVIWRDDPCGVPGLHLVVPADRAREVWMHLVTGFAQSADIGKRRLRAIGWAAFNATRVEAGRAIFGIDYDDNFVPAETGALQISRAVSFTKGCYPGQEIVARMHARGQVARQLVGIRMVDPDALPIAGTQIYDAESNVIGAITSSTVSPVMSNAAIALGIVKKPHFDVGRRLRVPAERAIRDAVVVDLPFYRVESPA